ncbi:unnamed protein product, partial [Onchocerca flexuosa]|uniref:PRA1 family protein n=1 Tax=Onchocerca flexuosa TaxID=387005 RepID=A0A183H1C0_9BILA
MKVPFSCMATAMYGFRNSSCIAIIIFVISLLTPNWTIIDFTNTDLEEIHVQLGVWGEWRTKTNGTKKVVEWIPHFPKPPEYVLRLADADLKCSFSFFLLSNYFFSFLLLTFLDFYLVQMVFGIISLVLMFSNNALAIYTFYHHRFIFKRLVACLYGVIAMCIVVTIEILMNSISEWNRSVAEQAK